MDRVHQSGAAVAAPATPGSFSTGYPTAGNPSGGVPATKPGPWWFHMVTEELRQVIVDGGLTPDGTDLTQLSAAIQALIAAGASSAHGRCRLVKSGANLVLQPCNGNSLVINGTVRSVPAAGASLAATSLTPGTTYYIYAYWTGSAMALEASTTGRATHTNGVEVKSGDTSRTLVGLARCVTGPAWADSAAQRFVLSWFNRRAMAGAGAFTANRAAGSSSWAELNTEIRCEFLAWSDDAVTASLNGAIRLPASGDSIYTSIGFDGTTPEDLFGYGQNPTVSSMDMPIGLTLDKAIAEGYHYATALAKRPSGSPALIGSATSAERSTLNITVRG